MNVDDYTQKLFDFLNRLRTPRKRARHLSPSGLVYAGLHRRLFAAVLDACIIALIMSPFNQWLMAYAYRDVDWLMVQQSGSEPGIFITSGLAVGLSKLIQTQFTVFAIYSLVFWHFYAATPGKLLLRLRVVNATTEEKINDWQALGRVFAYLAAVLPFMLGIFAMEWNPRHRGWHDRLARTAVVVLPRQPMEPKN